MMEQGLNSDSARIFPVQLLRQELLKHQQKEDKKSAKKQNKDGVTSTSVPSVLRGTSLDQHLDGMFKNCAADKNDDDDDDVAIPGWKIWMWNVDRPTFFYSVYTQRNYTA